MITSDFSLKGLREAQMRGHLATLENWSSVIGRAQDIGNFDSENQRELVGRLLREAQNLMKIYWQYHEEKEQGAYE